MKKIERNSSIELLRIMAMFFIVLSHCSVHGMSGLTSQYIYNNVVNNIFSLGNLGVVIFVIITGYYYIGKEIKFKKILFIESQILFYSILFYILSALINHDNVFSLNLLKSCFPIIFRKYWFMTAYISLFIFIPFINKFLKILSKKEYTFLVLLMIIVGFIIPTLTTSDLYFNELFQFFSFYFIGGYIKQNVEIIKYNKKCRILLISLLCFLVLSNVIIEICICNLSLNPNYGTYFFNRNSIFILVVAICIFIIFLNIPQFYNKHINLLSSTMFGVYLIHDNNDFRNILWHKIFKLDIYIDKSYLFIVLITSAILIFIICVLLEFIRKKTLDNLVNSIINKIENISIKVYSFLNVR